MHIARSVELDVEKFGQTEAVIDADFPSFREESLYLLIAKEHQPLREHSLVKNVRDETFKSAGRRGRVVAFQSL